MIALSSTRQMVVPGQVDLRAKDAVLMGGITYEAEEASATETETAELAMRTLSRGWAETASRGGIWRPLTSAGKEVENISSTLEKAGFQTLQYIGTSATEEQFKKIGTEEPSPRILHIATHGFFYPDPEKAPSRRMGLEENETVFKWSDNPMVRSGLILAGGNYAWQHGKPAREGKEDGILTAYEISQMNLNNTELVVLSACETGLGDINGNEGVYGLQRAFKIAGAKYLIMSLWQVDDEETQEFMKLFYTHWLDKKMDIPVAFRQAQQEMRRLVRGKPYYWAGFVLIE
jgi:CHAT domain-containing protein